MLIFGFPIFALLVSACQTETRQSANSSAAFQINQEYIEIARRHVGFALPDPRNREFHRAIVQTARLNNGKVETFSICGWISSDKSTMIAPDGWVYPVIKDEGKTSPESWIEMAATSESMSLRIVSSTHPAQTISPLTPAFFVVRGETVLANQSYQKHILRELGPSYFVHSLRSTLHSRAATQMVQNEDAKAISSLENLQRLLKLESKYFRLASQSPSCDKQTISLDETRVLDDLKRRMTSKKQNEVTRHSNQVTKSEKIRQLIQDLENVFATSYFLPNHFKWEHELVPAKLISVGFDAIPQLVACKENDHRLTRTTTMSRTMDEHFIIPVSAIAAYCLEKINQQSKL
jgi:hypothetical protein